MAKLKTVALIPARGGSKRLPRKNITEFAGRPMLAWTVEAADLSGVFDHVVVSTDDDEIASVARAAGAEVLIRPARVSNDTAGLIDVIHHAFTGAWNGTARYCLLPPNCPLRNADDIRLSERVVTERSPAALISVARYGWTPPFRAQFLENNRLRPAFDEWMKKKSQEYPDVCCPSGAIYWSTPWATADSDTLYIDGLEGYMMPWHRAIDIDTHEDLQIAECIHHSLRHGYSFKS